MCFHSERADELEYWWDPLHSRIEEIRREISALSGNIATARRRNLIYFDNAATTMVPEQVLDRWIQYYRTCGGSPGRGSHIISKHAAEARLGARETIKAFLGIGKDAELVFCRSATEALNMAAFGLTSLVKPGNLVVATELEHHSNFLPWERLARRTGAQFEVVPCNRNGCIDLSFLEALQSKSVSVLTVTHTSNVTGYQPELASIVSLARNLGTILVLDAVQVPGHEPLCFDELGVDLMALSAHKMYAPKGIGALVGKREVLKKLEPMVVGGGAVHAVDTGRTILLNPPESLEAGTQDTASAVAWAESCRWILQFDLTDVRRHESMLTSVLRKGLREIPGFTLVPSGGNDSGSITSFVHERLHSHDLSHLLDEAGIAIRTGHMCAQPLLKALGYYSVNRVSFGIYNTIDEVEFFLNTLEKIAHGELKL